MDIHTVCSRWLCMSRYRVGENGSLSEEGRVHLRPGLIIGQWRVLCSSQRQTGRACGIRAIAEYSTSTR